MKTVSTQNDQSLSVQTTFTLNRFDQFATAITEKLKELLHTPVLVADNYRVVVAASQLEWIGLRLPMIDTQRLSLCVQVPLSLDWEAGELRVYQDTQGERVPEHVVYKIVQMVIDQVLLTDTLPDYHILKDKFLYHLLHGIITDASVIELHANNLGLDLTPPRAVILIDASEYLLDNGRPHWSVAGNVHIKRRVNSVVSFIVEFFSLPNDTICAYMGQGEIAILKATDNKNLANWASNEMWAAVSSWANLPALKRAASNLLVALHEYFKISFTIGIGRHHPGITGLAHSYEDARVALSLGRRFYGPVRVHCLDDLGIAAFAAISEERIKIDLARHILSPLDSEPELIETLISFFENNCSTTLTATALAIHRNTLYYRLNKITSLTGLDAREFDQAVQIRLALLLRSNS